MLAARSLLLLLPLAAAAIAARVKPLFVMVGDPIQLRPAHPESEKISKILWKNKDRLVAEWTSGSFRAYGKFQGRTTLNNVTGLLEIRGGTAEDSGTYEAEVNGRILDQGFQVEVIRNVPKPTVLVQPLSCGPSSITCSLNCDGAIDGAGAVNYSWRFGDGEWRQSEKKMVITKETESSTTFSCRMKNYVGHQDSDPVKNPFLDTENGGAGGGTVAVVVLLTLVLVAILVVGFIFRDRIRVFLSQRGFNTVSQSPADEHISVGQGPAPAPAQTQTQTPAPAPESG